MTGGTGAAPGADHAWLAKVLAGDPLACGLLDLARTLSVDDLDAAGRNGKATDSLLFTGGRDAVWA